MNINADNLELSKPQNQTSAARAALASGGKSPSELGKQSKLSTFVWIYRWGYTTSDTIQSLLNRTAGGYAKKLVAQGWLVSTRTKSGTPKNILTLSIQGLQEVERHASSLHQYAEINPYKVNQLEIRHYLIAQSATLKALKTEAITDYQTERMFSQSGNKSGEKQPDIVWITKAGLRIAVEIELSAKWGRDLDQFVLSVARALQSSKDEPARFNRFAVLSDSKAIIERYRDAVTPGADLSIWKKNTRGHWVIDKTIKVPDWLITKIDFRYLESK